MLLLLVLLKVACGQMATGIWVVEIISKTPFHDFSIEI